MEPVSRILLRIMWKVRATRQGEDILLQLFETDALTRTVVVQRLGKGWFFRSRGMYRCKFRIKRFAQVGVFALLWFRGL